MKMIYIRASNQLSGLNPMDVMLNMEHISSITPAKGGVLTVLKMNNNETWIVKATPNEFSTFLFKANHIDSFIIEAKQGSSFTPIIPIAEEEEDENKEK